MKAKKFDHFNHKVIVYDSRNNYVRFFYACDKDEARRLKISLNWAFNVNDKLGYKLEIIDIDKSASKDIVANIAPIKSKQTTDQKLFFEKLDEFSKRLDAIESMKDTKHANIGADLQKMKEKMLAKEIRKDLKSIAK